MAVNEVNTLIHTKDSEGNTTIHYPITKSDNVTLSDEAAAALGLGSGATADEALTTIELKDGYGFLDEGVDVRTLVGKNGWYMLAADRTYVNVPTGAVGFWGVFEVKDKTATLKAINGGMFYCSNIAAATPDNWIRFADYYQMPKDINFKTYWQLQQFSNLTDATATLDDIAKAMPIFSVFDSAFWVGQYAAIESAVTWQGNRKRIVIEKGTDDGYTVAHLYDIRYGTHWVNNNYYVETDGSLLWSGWDKIVYASELATLTGTAPATVED